MVILLGPTWNPATTAVLQAKHCSRNCGAGICSSFTVSRGTRLGSVGAPIVAMEGSLLLLGLLNLFALVLLVLLGIDLIWCLVKPCSTRTAIFLEHKSGAEIRAWNICQETWGPTKGGSAILKPSATCWNQAGCSLPKGGIFTLLGLGFNGFGSLIPIIPMASWKDSSRHALVIAFHFFNCAGVSFSHGDDGNNVSPEASDSPSLDCVFLTPSPLKLLYFFGHCRHCLINGHH